MFESRAFGLFERLFEQPMGKYFRLSVVEASRMAFPGKKRHWKTVLAELEKDHGIRVDKHAWRANLGHFDKGDSADYSYILVLFWIFINSHRKIEIHSPITSGNNVDGKVTKNFRSIFDEVLRKIWDGTFEERCHQRGCVELLELLPPPIRREPLPDPALGRAILGAIKPEEDQNSEERLDKMERERIRRLVSAAISDSLISYGYNILRQDARHYKLLGFASAADERLSYDAASLRGGFRIGLSRIRITFFPDNFTLLPIQSPKTDQRKSRNPQFFQEQDRAKLKKSWTVIVDKYPKEFCVTGPIFEPHVCPIFEIQDVESTRLCLSASPRIRRNDVVITNVERLNTEIDDQAKQLMVESMIVHFVVEELNSRNVYQEFDIAEVDGLMASGQFPEPCVDSLVEAILNIHRAKNVSFMELFSLSGLPRSAFKEKNIVDIDLSGQNLSILDLSGSKFVNAIIDENTIFPSNFDGRNLVFRKIFDSSDDIIPSIRLVRIAKSVANQFGARLQFRLDGREYGATEVISKVRNIRRIPETDFSVEFLGQEGLTAIQQFEQQLGL